MKSASSKIAAAAAALFASAGALAALPFGTLEWVEQSATVSNTEQIDVWVRFTLAPTSPALSFTSNPLTGFDSADLPTEGRYFNPNTQQSEIRPIASITSAYLNTYVTCNDTFSGDIFTGGCNGNTTNYRFDFFTISEPGKPAVSGGHIRAFDLQPGESYEYVFAQFTPAAGGAQPGTYQLFNTGLTLNFDAFDAEGNSLSPLGLVGIFGHELAVTCPQWWQDAGCAFTRTVIPGEPGSSAGAPLLPIGIGPGGGFEFEFTPTPGVPVFIDPLVAIGYDYAITAGGNSIVSAIFPVLAGDPDGYEIYALGDISPSGFLGTVEGGEDFSFGAGVTGFSLRGISEDAMLDPDNPTAFVTGLVFATGETVAMTQTPVSVNVIPEPGTMLMLLGGLGVVGLRLRRQEHGKFKRTF